MDYDQRQATLNPVCTGATVIAVKFEDGVALAADRLASYGRMARYKKTPRLFEVGKKTLMGISGDYADYQYLKTLIEDKSCEMKCRDPEAELNPKALFSWLTVVMYNRRCRMDPFQNTFLVAGVQGEENTPFLGSVNLRGVAFDNPYIATGLGVMLVQQTLEDAYRRADKEERQLGKDEAIELLEKCLEILYYRDTQAHNEYDIGVVTKEGCDIRAPRKITGSWGLAAGIVGYE